MAFWRKLLQGKARDEPDTSNIPAGRYTTVGGIYNRSLSPYRSRVASILTTLRSIPEQTQALEFVRKVTPDVAMAVWNFVRLSNQGHEMAFYSITDKERKSRLRQVELEWREFASRVNQISNAGLDGLIDILHQSAYVKGAQAVEVEVNTSRTDIVDVYPVVPQTIVWELGERNGRQEWIPYQQSLGKKISLEPGKANFFWVPTDPDIEDPRGTLALAPVLQSIDFQMQILADLQAVLHRQGWPRNDIVVLTDTLMRNMPPEVKIDPKKQRQWIQARFNEIQTAMEKLDPDSDYFHTDDVEIKMNPGANASRGLDVRAIFEGLDTQVLSGLKQMAIFVNRNQGITESWGSVQFRIFCSGIQSIQRGSKRLIEEVARLWLRVRGIQAMPVFTHNTIDWENEEQRWTVRLMEEEFHAIAQLMGWETGDEAASEVLGRERADREPVEGIRIAFSKGGSSPVDDKLSGRQQQTNRDLRVIKK